MNRVLLRSLALVVVCLFSLPLWAADPQPTVVAAGLHTGYVPQGFDDNDRVQLMVEGIFSDTCYKVGPYKTKLNGSQLDIYQAAYKYMGICLEMLVPYHQLVELGIMQAGRYDVVDGTTGGGLGQLPVTHARSASADDFLYAPVSDASIVQGKVVISGTFPDSCFYFKDVRTRIVNNVIEVLPIVEHAALNQCHRGFYPFQKVAPVQGLNQGRYLLHVRSLEGAAVNKLQDVF